MDTRTQILIALSVVLFGTVTKADAGELVPGSLRVSNAVSLESYGAAVQLVHGRHHGYRHGHRHYRHGRGYRSHRGLNRRYRTYWYYDGYRYRPYRPARRYWRRY